MTCDCPLSCLAIEEGAELEFLGTVRRHDYIVWKCGRCGERYTCECFRGVMEAVSTPGWQRLIPGYLSEKRLGLGSAKEIEKKVILRGGGGLQSLARRDLQSVRYRPGICHVCRGVTPSPAPRNTYGDAVIRLYRPYIMAEAIRSSIGTRKAENRLRDRIGIPRIGEGWVSETLLYEQLRTLFPDLRIEREASPEWLGRMRFDVLFPDVGVAVEYQGEQHYRPVEVFGGAEGFERASERDRLKRELAEKAGVTVVEFRHDEVLTDEEVQERVASAIESKRTKREPL